MLPTHLYIFMCAHLCAYPCGGSWWTLEDPHHLCLFCLLKQGLSLGWSCPQRLDWLASEFPRSTCLCLPSTGIVSATTQGFFWASDSGAHACTVSPSLTESSPQSNYLVFLIDLYYFFHINGVCVTRPAHAQSQVAWPSPLRFSLAVTSKQFSCVCIFLSSTVGYVSHSYSVREVTVPLLLR